MKRIPNPLPLAIIILLAHGPLARAVVATGLSSFEGIEEPAVKYFPATRQFQPDSFVNITDEGNGVIRMFLRYQKDWWDGDRDMTNRDRQRAEVKGLGPHQLNGETFEYSTTWRSNPEFKGTNRFCHIFQLKAINGDDGAPLVTLSLRSGSNASVHCWSGNERASQVVRGFTWKPGVWQTVCIRVRTSTGTDGEVSASVDGDAFQGKTGIDVFRPEATEYRPKWGLYRGANPGMPMEDDYIEHKDVSARKLPATADADAAQAALEVKARAMAPQRGLDWLQGQPESAARDLALATIAAQWAEKEPAAAMGWTEKLAPGKLRDDTTMRVFNRWSYSDAAGAMKWMAGVAPRADLDWTLFLLATDTTFRYVNRPVALQGAALISDADLRERAFAEVTGIWARRERDAAVQFIQATPALNAAQKEKVLAGLHGRNNYED